MRFLALASMYVAHVAPVPGPAHVLELSEYLTMPLFALLVGVGAQLGSRRTGPGHWAAVVVRGLALLALGLALERAQAQVVIVLVHLGVLVLVAALLARLPDLALALVGTAALVGGPLLVQRTSIDLVVRDGLASRLAGLAWVDGPYRLVPMVLYAVIGILVARHVVSGRGAGSVAAPGLLGAGLLVGAAAMLAAEQKGLVDLVPYSGTLQETVVDALVATGVCLVGLAAARALDRGAPAPGSWDRWLPSAR